MPSAIERGIGDGNEVEVLWKRDDCKASSIMGAGRGWGGGGVVAPLAIRGGRDGGGRINAL